MSLDPCAVRGSLERSRNSVQRLAPPEACRPTATSRTWRALHARWDRDAVVLRATGTRREHNAKRPPRRNRAGALLESLHHTSSDYRTQESAVLASCAGLSAL